MHCVWGTSREIGGSTAVEKFCFQWKMPASEDGAGESIKRGDLFFLFYLRIKYFCMQATIILK